MKLDPVTLHFAVAMLAWTMAAVVLSVRGLAPQHSAGLVQWSAAMLTLGAAFLLYWLRGFAPWALSFLLANLFVVATPLFTLRAYARLLEAPVPPAAYGAMAFGAAGVLATDWADLPRAVTLFSVSTAVAVALFLSARCIWGHAVGRTRVGAATAGVVGLAAGLFAWRAVVGLSLVVGPGGPGTEPSPYSTSVAHLAFLMVVALLLVVSTIGFLALVNQRREQEALENASRDSLTGMYTRSAFFERAGEVDRANPHVPYAVVMFDLDHFKSVNDTFGHAAGDATLAHAARLIAGLVRIADISGRYGGEEFCVLLRDCGEREASEFARRAVAEAALQVVDLRDGQRIRYTLSAGYAVAGLRPEGDGQAEVLLDVIERADRALYAAKRAGRNRAVAAVPMVEEARLQA